MGESVLDLLEMVKCIERCMDSLTKYALQTCRRVAEMLNNTVAPEVSRKFNVDCRFDADIGPDSCFPDIKLYVLSKEEFDDVEEAYKWEDRTWLPIDEYLRENYSEVYKHFSVIVLPRWKDD